MINTALRDITAIFTDKTINHPKPVAALIAKHERASELFNATHRNYAADLAALPVKDWDQAIEEAAAEQSRVDFARSLLHAGLYQKLDNELTHALRDNLADYSDQLGAPQLIADLTDAVADFPDDATLDYQRAVHGGYGQALATIINACSALTAIAGLWGPDIAAIITTAEPISVRREARHTGRNLNTIEETQQRDRAESLTIQWRQQPAETLVTAIANPDYFAVSIPQSLADYRSRQENWENLKLMQKVA